MVVGNTVLDSIEITAEGGGINIVELHHRETAGIKEDGRPVADVVDHLTEEVDRHQYGQSLNVG